jgi:putative hydrolase of the HAD superfamily
MAADPVKLRASMTRSGTRTQGATRAVLFDALGTLVELEPPWVHLATALDLEPGDDLVRAVRKEMDYYKEHSHEGRDAESLAALRARCADILSWELDREVPVDTMMAAIRFNPYPDAAPALKELRKAGLRLVCVSNWDVSLTDVLDGCGLAELLDGVVTSAGSGSRKPDPVIFSQALEIAGCGADEAVHVGDTAEEDVAGADAAGIRALLLDRDGAGDIGSLAEVAPALQGSAA